MPDTKKLNKSNSSKDEERIQALVDQNHQLNERLKLTEAGLSTVRSENMQLTARLVIANQLITDLFAKCPACGTQTLRLDWDNQVYVLACDNSSCGRFRQPMKTIRKDSLTAFTLI